MDSSILLPCAPGPSAEQFRGSVSGRCFFDLFLPGMLLVSSLVRENPQSGVCDYLDIQFFNCRALIVG